jgi:3-dehydro-L-gulonate 2-dehydrogenase
MHVVLDMAMSQYSMGKLQLFKEAGREAPLGAGFDVNGQKTRDPAAVLAGGAAMPIGAWKGAGLSLVLDLLAAMLAGGRATHEIKPAENERGVSQVFLAIDAAVLGGAEEAGRIVEGVLADLKTGGEGVLYPGERSMAARQESAEKGVAVERGVWEGILGLRGR